MSQIDKTAMLSLWQFQEKLDAMDHSWTQYDHIEQLKHHFSDQLQKLLADSKL